MIPIKPNPALFLLPDEYEVVTYAKHQTDKYLPLSSIRTPDGRVASQWSPDANERILIANGAPITLVLHTFRLPLQPIQIMVGGADLR